MSAIAIVGAGLGGLRAAEGLRSGGWREEIVVFGDEPHPPYTRPPLSKAHLTGDSDSTELHFPQRARTADVTWRLSSPVESCSLTKRTLTLVSGEEHSFTGLVVASGVRPRRLAHVPAASAHTVRTVDDAARLRPLLRPKAKLVVLGSGFIGCEVAATANKLGCEVSVASLDSAPLVDSLGDLVGDAIRRRHEATGITFHLGRRVIDVAGDPGRQTVTLDDGTVLEAHVVVSALGSQPNTQWLEGNQLDLADGVLCDSALRVVGTHRVVAVGDVARFPLPRFGITRRVEHWHIPGESARHATKTLIGDLRLGDLQTSDFSPLPQFWSDQNDLRIQAFGVPSLADHVEIVEGDLDHDAAVGYFRGQHLVGVVLVGMPNRAMHYRTLVKESTDTPDGSRTTSRQGSSSS